MSVGTKDVEEISQDDKRIRRKTSFVKIISTINGKNVILCNKYISNVIHTLFIYMQQASNPAPQLSQTETTHTTNTSEQNTSSENLTLTLQGRALSAGDRSVTWETSTVDNEHLNRKKSKG